MSYFPLLAATAVLAGLLSAIFIAIDLSKHPQRMKVMNAVWVLTGLWAGLLGLGAYILFGRQGLRLVPLCPFVAGYIQKHPDWKRIVMQGINIG